jgi:NHLM bacteriocin system ABC transporter peptidase/ATP-binding protein
MAPTEQAARREHRVKVPTVLQMEVTECGAASLAMVLAAHGRTVSLDELRVASGVSRDGATAKNIVRAARGYGLTTRAFKREPDALKTLAFPIIVHWRMAHFVVVEGWHPGGWYLNDPGTGPRRVDHAEFDASFTGIAIELQPSPEFQTTTAPPALLPRLLSMAGSRRSAGWMAALVALALVIPSLAAPQMVSRFGDALAGGPGIDARTAVVGLLIAVVSTGLLLGVQALLSTRLSTKVSMRISATMVERLLRLPASFHAQRGPSAMAQRAMLIDQMSEGVAALFSSLAAGVVTSAVAAVILVIVSPIVAAVGLIMAVSSLVLLRWSMRTTRDASARTVVDFVEMGSLMTASLSQVESIKASGAEDGVIARGISLQHRLLESHQRVGASMVVSSLMPGALNALAATVIGGAALWQIERGALSPGALLAVLPLAAMLLGPLGQVVAALDQVVTLGSALQQIDDVLDAPTEDEQNPAALDDAPGVLRGALELRDVSFGYSPLSSPTVTGLDLRLTPGRRVALVGPSGCGKSTVSRLVTGLYRPWTGELLIDGRPRSAHAREVLCDSLALVDQDVSIFGGTIRDNVTLWDPTIEDRDVLDALADAQLGELVARRPGGLDAELADGGADLSGGERQRLEIARALVRRPVLLVLDEATSALDPVTEQRIDAAIRRRGITCLVIAHRLSTIRDCDEIVVLDRGVVVERGNHDELVAAGGTYATLVTTS